MALDDFEFDMLLNTLTPRLEVIDGVMVAVDDDGGDQPDRSTLRDWMQELKGDVAAVERMVNHRHIESVMPWLTPGRTREQTLRLARLWALALKGAAVEAQLSVTVTIHSSGDEVMVTVCRTPAP